jgi:hypothetical protein
MGSSGFERPGFECAACKAVLPLFLVAVGKHERNALPDPFHAKCPFCGHRGAYPKSNIQQIHSIGPQ